MCFSSGQRIHILFFCYHISEQYLQRLEKWRSEREAKKEGKDVKNKQRPLAEIKGNKHVTAARYAVKE